MREGMKVYTEDGDIAAIFYSVRREGEKLIVDGKALEMMRMDMIITAEEIFKGLKIIFCWQAISFFLLLPYFYLKHTVLKRG